MGIEAGMTPEEAAEALSGYAISGMRQRVRLWNGIKVVEDCYNAAPDSMNAALDTLSGMECEGRKICVFADMRELGSASDESHRAIGQHAAGWRTSCWSMVPSPISMWREPMPPVFRMPGNTPTVRL